MKIKILMNGGRIFLLAGLIIFLYTKFVYNTHDQFLQMISTGLIVVGFLAFLTGGLLKYIKTGALK